MAILLTKTSFFKSLIIFFFVSQSCDLPQTLICNIIKAPYEIYNYCISLIIRLSVLLLLILLLKKTNINRLKNVIRCLPKHIYVLITINALLMGAITSITGYDLSIDSNIIK